MVCYKRNWSFRCIYKWACAKTKRALRKKRYLDNKDASQLYMKEYRESNRNAIRESQKQYYEQNKDAKKLSVQQHYEQNKDA